MRRSGDCYLLVAPYLLFFTVFTVVPVLVAMGFSFTQFNMLETPSFIGLKNYAHMFSPTTISPNRYVTHWCSPS